MNTYRVHDATTRNAVMGAIADLDMDKSWVVKTTLYRPGRTLSQNALFHKWAGEIADFTGDSDTDMKDHLKRMFCPVTSTTTLNDVTIEHRSTARLDIAQMSKFMERVSAFAHGDLGVRLTVPEEAHL